MIVQKLELEQFRNYERLQAEFDSRVNLIYGDNAQGKTNLLEAIAYLSSARSHRARYDRDLIRVGADGALVRGTLLSRDRTFVQEARLIRGRSRQLYSNGVRLKSAGALGEVLNTVLFCPEDLFLIREGGAARRRFLDQAICQLRPRYEQALTEYGRLYESKTRILRDWKEKPALLDTLDVYSAGMVEKGAILIHYRAHFIKRLRINAPAIHRDFSGGRENLELNYETVSSVDDPLRPVRELIPLLRSHMESHRQAELEARQCLSGPHKDDLAVLLNGMPARTFGSQGQARTAALSLKLAQREISQEETGEWPVLLLDDVLSELDPRRQAFVLNRIRGGQIFITCCEEDKLEGLEGGKAFHIENGALLRESRT